MNFLILLFRSAAAAFSDLIRSAFPRLQRVPVRIAATRKARSR